MRPPMARRMAPRSMWVRAPIDTDPPLNSITADGWTIADQSTWHPLIFNLRIFRTRRTERAARTIRVKAPRTGFMRLELVTAALSGIRPLPTTRHPFQAVKQPSSEQPRERPPPGDATLDDAQGARAEPRNVPIRLDFLHEQLRFHPPPADSTHLILAQVLIHSQK